MVRKPPSYDRSFASNEKRAACWHATKNGDVKPRDVFKSSGKKYWFMCNNDHDFDMSLSNVTKGKWCSSCHQTPSYDRSFASNEERASYWHATKNGKVKPRDVFKSANKKYWFTCDNDHDFYMSLSNVTNLRQWCPNCPKSPSSYEQSFASNEERAACWHITKNGDVKPRDVFKSTNKNYWFTCDNGHDFDIQLKNVTSGQWCSSCINKTETHVFETLRDKGYDVGEKSNRKMFKTKYRYDIIIDDKKLIVEVDGPQHFRQVSNWGSYEETYKTDIYKEELAHKNGYRVVRISQEYVWYRQISKNKTEWISKLVKAIESEHENQFISDSKEYIHRSVITNQIPS